MPGEDFDLFHWAWNALLTAFGGLVFWNWKTLNHKVDEGMSKLDTKVDKSELEQLRTDLRERWRDQDNKHLENTRRLDRIFEGVTKIRQNTE